MADYRVNLDIYNGPLDLLLYLIRRSEVEIHDIPIASITEQYLAYANVLEQLNIDNAAEFLVMASTLMEIKSALLLPRQEIEGQEEDDLSDPRLELVRQLLEYKQFKDAANTLGEAAAQQSLRFPRSLADLKKLQDQQKQEQQQEFEMEGLQIWDLFDTFTRMMQATLAARGPHQVIHDNTPIDLYETDLLDRAQHEAPLTFEGAFAGCKSRGEMIGLFLAMLELIRQNLIRIEQEEAFGPIYIFALTDEEAGLAVAHAISQDIDALPSVINKDKKHQDTPSPSPPAEASDGAE